MKIKVNYDPKTTIVKGYFPESINYPSIPEPFIEIEASEQQSGKKMCVIDGVYQEYKPSTEEKKQVLKIQLIAFRRSYLALTDWIVIRAFDNPENYLVPEEIKNKRMQARSEINQIEIIDNLKALNNFDVNFK